ncbi:MAG: hypothetical protein ACI9H8_001571 [Lysobacterales bacterium]|jgi:hypothetical protein
MPKFQIVRVFICVCATAVLASCSGTKIINQWHTDAGPISPPKMLAVIAMAPEEGMRFAIEKLMADQINDAGGHAVASTSIKGMRGKLTREKAEAALKEVGADAVVVVFITGGGKGEKLQRSDYHLQYVGSATSYNWLSPQFVDVYTVQEGPGYYEQTRTLNLESTYYQFPAEAARWAIVTKSSALEYRETAKVLTGKIIGQMKKDGSL